MKARHITMLVVIAIGLAYSSYRLQAGPAAQDMQVANETTEPIIMPCAVPFNNITREKHSTLIWCKDSLQLKNYREGLFALENFVGKKNLAIILMQPKLLLAEKFRWTKSPLLVYFLDTPDKDITILTRTLNTANGWFEGLHNEFVPTPNRKESHIRVSFANGQGYKSVIGTKATEHDTTLWLSSVHKKSTGEFTRVVLHEFGHALGFLHEHQNPGAHMDWDTGVVMRTYRAEPYKWEDFEIQTNILWPITNVQTHVKLSKHDSNSIMIYSFPDSFRKSGKGIPWPRNLSAQDKKEVSELYN